MKEEKTTKRMHSRASAFLDDTMSPCRSNCQNLLNSDHTHNFLHSLKIHLQYIVLEFEKAKWLHWISDRFPNSEAEEKGKFPIPKQQELTQGTHEAAS